MSQTSLTALTKVNKHHLTLIRSITILIVLIKDIISNSFQYYLTTVNRPALYSVNQIEPKYGTQIREVPKTGVQSPL